MRQGQLVFLRRVFGYDQLLLQALVIYLGAKLIEARGGSGVVIAGGLIERDLRRFHLGLCGIDLRFIGQNPQIGIPYRQDDHLLRILSRQLRCFEIMFRSQIRLDRIQAEYGPGKVRAQIGVSKRSNHFGHARKPETLRRNVHLLIGLFEIAVDGGKQFLEVLEPIAARAGDLRGGEQQAQVVLQASLHRIIQRQRQRILSRRSLGHSTLVARRRRRCGRRLLATQTDLG